MGELIKVSNVSKAYSLRSGFSLEVLQSVDLSIDSGLFVTLVGPSGCGKSTLLNIMAGLTTATTGEVLLDKEKVTIPQPKRIAMVFQEGDILPWRTVQKNVEFGLELVGVGKEERNLRSKKYLDLVGLAEFEGYYPSQLSGGMRQRVAIARALALETDILLMDEPFGALDEQTRLVLGHQLVEIWQKTSKTIIFVTHSLLEAAYLSDKIVVLSGRPGRILRVLEVNQTRPRDLESEELVKVRRLIWPLIQGQVMKQLSR